MTKPNNNQIMSTETTLCWISGEDIDKFTEELQALITKYAI